MVTAGVAAPMLACERWAEKPTNRHWLGSCDVRPFKVSLRQENAGGIDFRFMS